MKTQIQRSHRGLFSAMCRHPYLMTAAICGMLLPFGLADRANITAKSCIYLGVVISALAVFAVIFFDFGKDRIEKLILSAVSVLTVAAGMLTIGSVENKTIAIPIIALIVTAGVLVFIKLNYEIDDKVIIAALIVLGITVRFVYVLYTGYNDRQHDVGYFNFTWGHANYIEYWYNNGLKLPDFDVRTIWQYYHPPFHHWLMAGLMSLLTSLNVEYIKAAEATQMLPMMYSCMTMIVSYKLFRMVKLKGNPLIAASAIVCFHPTFIIFSGSFNNDMLLVLFMLAAIVWALRWYREPELRNIIPLALCIGLGMMTKLSGWMVAPAVAFLFLTVLIKNIKKPLKYIGQFSLFGAICVPLGLWWQIRNLLLFKVPITYVPDVGVNSPTYSGNMPLAQRLFDFGGGQLSYVYGSFTAYGAPYNEFNPTVGLFKTAIFDECNNNINDLHFPQIKITGPILFWISVVLFLICIGCFFFGMVKKSRYVGKIEQIFFVLLFAVLIISYYLFCIAYPMSCTFNIRYVMPLIPLCAMGLALILQETYIKNKPSGKWFRRVMYGLTGAFCTLSCVMFTQIGATQ